MLDKLMRLLGGGSDADAQTAGRDLEIAVAALLIEAGRMDQKFDAGERTVIERLLTERFALDAAAVADVVANAEAKIQSSEQYYPFTQEICARLSGPERAAVIEMLWQVAYADGTLDPYEDSLIRQVAALVHVDDRARALARQRALQSLDLDKKDD